MPAPSWVRSFCLSLPHATEEIKWGNDLVFCLAGKMFAITLLEPGEVAISFKASAEEFGALIERPGFRPAPYLARAQWVALESFDAAPRKELERLIRQSYDLVRARLPKKTREALG